MKLIVITIVAMVIMLPAFLSSQERIVLKPDGKIIKYKGDLENLEVQRIKEGKEGNLEQQNIIKSSSEAPNFPNGDMDTLKLPGPWIYNFGFWGQDVMLQWFEAPADLYLHQVGFACYENPDNMAVSVKLVRVNWTGEELDTAAFARRGYYEALGNGYNDITAFWDNWDRTGGWTSIDGSPEPFGSDIWSDGGVGFPFIPTGNDTVPIYEWVDLNILFTPEINTGEVFGIAVKHLGPVMDANRIGIWASDTLHPAWKFYANGRLDPGVDFGWWSREFTWNFAAIVEYIIPVELTSFTANVIDNAVILKWSTATETNNAGFSVERSNDNTAFSEIAYVEGNGTTTEIHDYTFIDRYTNSGRYFYRLKQIDYDGSFNHSGTVEADVNVPGLFVLLQNYPNPFNPSTNIKYNIPESEIVKLAVYNTLGEEVAVLVDGLVEAGFYEVTFDASSLPSGAYFYRLESGNKVEVKKMLLMK
jgi:hypothetical protein